MHWRDGRIADETRIIEFLTEASREYRTKFDFVRFPAHHLPRQPIVCTYGQTKEASAATSGHGITN
jgi:hypothetical protein